MADDGPSTLKWSGNLDISRATAVYQELSDALDLGRPVELDAKGIERVDTSIVQLLSVFFKQAQDQCVEVKWTSESELLNKIARALDLETAIGLVEGASVAEGS